MTAIVGVRKRAGRKESKPVRRAQLIKATIDCLAKRGYADTTLADVADRAGLSRGIVNFHFESKEKLLVATLRHLADEYSDLWHDALERAGPSPAHRLWALVAVDFHREVCTARKIAAWLAFWGEAKSRPIYQQLCGARDLEYQDMLQVVCAQIEAEGAYGHDAANVALGLDTMLEGLWMRLLFVDGPVTREQLHACAIEYLAILFPKHFTREGVRAG
jgi:TetR/AcrR family transcriptional repressor of bet genes